MKGLNTILSMIILFGLFVNAAPILPSGNGTVVQLLATRDDAQTFDCGGLPQLADPTMANTARAAITAMATDVCSAGQGAKQCVPISCATGAVVTLCNNDPNRPYLVPSACGDVSDIVGRIIAQCGNSGTWTDLDQQFTISVAANNCGSAFTSW